ncbi:MAG TPA: M20/M25/M40 family metallo-hydrolase, partial [Haliangium sp.]|nr:M20/M25/M40 family metallo-hydrolase [Haliangium sp.]
ADRRAYDKLAYLTDRIGHRLSGSPALEQAVAWAMRVMREEGHENVRAQKVMVPHWVRGQESASLIAPVTRPMALLGLGQSVGTGLQGITAEVVVVESFEELEQMGAAKVSGKIVLFNKKMAAYTAEHGSGYGDVVGYRSGGAVAAAKLGARAMLMRSVTAHSLRTPHTGSLRYDDKVPKIPGAAISTEDAELIARLVASGETVKVRLTMGARMLPDAASANVIAELVGREAPGEIVLIGCHIDSWDVGQGAHDDGAGCVVMMQALTVLRELGLRPRRTIRVVLFTNEENGLRGAFAYAEENPGAVTSHVMAMEADSGGFAPHGFSVEANEHALVQMRDIATLLAPLGATRIDAGGSGADLIPLARAGVPGLGVRTEGSRYFDYHHTDADTLDKVDPVHLAGNVAAVATVAYVIADMPQRFGQPAAGEPDESEDPAALR